MDSASTASKHGSRRLLFDCRYGWVVDEWKDPSEEALTGGRGMFCVLPLAKTILKAASLSVHSAASSTAKALDIPDLFSIQVLQANLHDQLRKFTCLMQKPDFRCFNLGGNSKSAVCSARIHMESRE